MERAQELFQRLEHGGADEVDRLIDDKVIEELHLDYKISADDGAGSRLHNNDRNNLSKAVSGFGNSEGGIIVWGVTCKNDPQLGDIPTSSRPIQDPERFRGWIERAVSGATVPPHDGVRSCALPILGKNVGYVVTLVPEGRHPPYQALPDQRYLIRAGSGFAPVPHAVLAGLFGRKPSPKIIYNYVAESASIGAARKIELPIGILLHNTGRGIATDIFLNLSVWSNGGQNCSVEFSQSDSSVWNGQFSFGHMFHLITRPEIRLPPEAHLMPITFTLKLAPPFDRELWMRGLCGATGSASMRFELNREPQVLQAAYQLLENTPTGPKLSADNAAKIRDILFPGK